MSFSIGLCLSQGIQVIDQIQEEVSSLAPVISAQAYQEASQSWVISTDMPQQGEWCWARLDDTAADGTPDTLGGWVETVLESGTLPVGSSSSDLAIPETGTTGTSYKLCLYQRVADTISNVISTVYIAQNTAPILTDLLTSGLNEMAQLGWTTDTGTGTLYWVLSEDGSQPTLQQIIQGQDATGQLAIDTGSFAIVDSGSQAGIVATSLTNDTTYTYHITQSDGFGNYSAVASSSVVPTSVGLPNLARQRTDTVIDSSGNTTLYQSAAIPIETGTNRGVLAVVSLCVPNPPLTTIEVSLGSQVMDLTTEQMPSSAGVYIGLFFLKDGQLPVGPQVLTVTTNQTVRSCLVEMTQYQGVDQITPFGPTVFDSASKSPANLTLSITEDTSILFSALALRITANAVAPIAVSNGTVLMSQQTGASSSNDNYLAVTEDPLGFAGQRTHSYTFGANTAAAILAAEMRQN